MGRTREEVVSHKLLEPLTASLEKANQLDHVSLNSETTRVKQIEDKLAESESLCRLLCRAIEQVTESIVVTDPNGAIIHVNPAFERVTGYKAYEVIGKNPRILQSGQQTHEFYTDLWDTLTSGKAWSGRFINRRKDGTFW